MQDITDRRMIDRPFEEVAAVFDGPVSEWLPVIAGPAERSWRTGTREGVVHVQVQLRVSPVFVQPDGTHWRDLMIEADPTQKRAFLTSLLSPRVTGDLGIEPLDDGTRTSLRFRGRSSRRNALTGWIERVLVGDLLVGSGMHTLLDHVVGSLATADADRDQPGESEATVVRARVRQHP